MFKEGTLPRPDAGAIYVVYLDPDCVQPWSSGCRQALRRVSRFSQRVRRKDSLCRGAVQSDFQDAYQIALRALVVAALNPPL